jgi:hypothetical protein
MVSHTRGRENRGEREKSSSGRKSRTKTSKKQTNTGGTNRTGGRNSRQWAWGDSRDPKRGGRDEHTNQQKEVEQRGEMSNNEDVLKTMS